MPPIDGCRNLALDGKSISAKRLGVLLPVKAYEAGPAEFNFGCLRLILYEVLHQCVSQFGVPCVEIVAQ